MARHIVFGHQPDALGPRGEIAVGYGCPRTSMTATGGCCASVETGMGMLRSRSPPTGLLDTRQNAVTPTFDGSDYAHPLRLTPAKASEPAMKEAFEVSRAVDAAGLPVTVGNAPPSIRDEKAGASCDAPGAFVFARGSKYSLATTIVGEASSAEEKAAVAALDQESTVDVIVTEPGDESASRTLYMTFGVVKRQLNPAASSAPSFFWTMLAADVLPRCSFDSDGD